MCKNARNRCSVFVAMDKHGQIDEAVAAFVRMVDGRENKGIVAVPRVQGPLD